MDAAFRISVKRYGPTLRLAPAGELDGEGRAAFERAERAVDDGVVVVACGMEHVPFMDAAGLHCLLDFAERLDARGVAVFFFHWRSQPLHLLDLVDVCSPASGSGRRSWASATAALRRDLGTRAYTGRARGAVAAGFDRVTGGVRVRSGR
ncbi:STAS domain-containing protein [Streptomyces sp. NPDC058664]|uniref:STAS domain-containing protein n=1 Tax=unclassified Streptomyces TaxID=2593676 RepID=UPI00365612D7